ncbi:MAG: TetR/AcrR family transcriptional regulator, partial [Actinobacteria bacterium]|nr:TetR/AcrR family transcriptional regulator [Actinomycetota bacterium]
FLRLARQAWTEWAVAAVEELGARPAASTRPALGSVAGVLATTLVQRPLFCDLLAHVPLNLERGVSVSAVKDFKLVALAAVTDVATAVERCTGLRPAAALNVVTTATAMAGALWQMAAPGTELRALYETDPDLAHAVVDVQPRLTDILTALLTGYCHHSTTGPSH